MGVEEESEQETFKTHKYYIDGLITKLQGGKLRSEYQTKSWLFMGKGLLIQITKSAV